MNALTGLRVLVTRPAHQAEPLCAALAARGAECLRLPVIEIQPIAEQDAGYQSLKNRFLDLNHYHKIIVVSANAAQLGGDWVDRYWPQLPVGIQWFAIGKATAKRLEELGINAQTAAGDMHSEALLADPKLDTVAGEKILILRGQGGRELLADTLRERGAVVDYADLYRREAPRYDDAVIESIIYNQLPSVILLTSGEAIDNFVTLALGSSRQFPLSALQTIPVVVPSQRVAQRAREQGFKTLLLAKNASDEAMLESLYQLPLQT